MAVYTDVTDVELEGFLAGYAIGQPIAFKGIAEGVENSNFLLETQAARYILTVFERRARPDDLPFFLALMSHLAGRGFPCATPIADRSGRTLNTMRARPAAIVAFLPGLSVRRPTSRHCRLAGEGLAWLHLAAADFPDRRPNDLGQAAWIGLFADQAGAAENLKPGLAAVIAADLRHLADRWPDDLPAGIIHADFFPDNVFFTGEAFAGAIDFYFAAWDCLAYDIGVALNAWCFEADGSFNLTSARAFVEGYERRRRLGDAERRALPILAHGAAMRFFLTRLADWGPAPSGAVVRPKDPLEYERKLAVHRAGVSIFEAGG